MDGEFQKIVDSLPEKPPRSRLEPYGELIDELRGRGRTYREIAGVLAKACRLEVSISTLHDFVKVRSRRKRTSARRNATNAVIAPPIAPKAIVVDWHRNPARKKSSGESQPSKLASQ